MAINTDTGYWSETDQTDCVPDIPSVNASSFAAGGGAVPPELSTELLGLIYDNGCVEGFARHYPMKRETLVIRQLTAGVEGYWVGAMCVKEKDAPELGAVELVARKMAVIVPFEDQLLEDMDINMVAEVKKDVTKKFIEKIDKTFLGYEPTSPFDDSLSGNVPAGHAIVMGADADNVDLAGDISAAISQIEIDGMDPNGMITHKGVKHMLRNLRDLNNNLIYTTDLGACTPRERYCVFGVPICFTNQAGAQSSPAGYEILVADFEYVLVGDRSGITVAMSNSATLTSGSADNINTFEQDMTAKMVGPFRSDSDCKVTYMLETPSIPRYSSTLLVDSENATGAGNQQGSHTRPSVDPSETTRKPLGYFPYSKVMI